MTAMKTARMTGGAAMVEGLLRNGVDTLFALPGVQLNHFFDAVYDKRNALRVLNARHEQGAAYMAFGYAIATGRVGAFAVVPGPGILNTTAALSTAYGCSQPVLAITGQINAAAIDRGFGLLHEIRDQPGTLASVINGSIGSIVVRSTHRRPWTKPFATCKGAGHGRSRLRWRWI